MSDTQDTINSAASIRTGEDGTLYSAPKPMQPFTQVQAKPRVILPSRSSSAPSSNRIESPRLSARTDVAVTALPLSRVSQADQPAPARNFIQPRVHPDASRPVSSPVVQHPVSGEAPLTTTRQAPQSQNAQFIGNSISREAQTPIQSEARRSLPQSTPSDSRQFAQFTEPAISSIPALRLDRAEYRPTSTAERNGAGVERSVDGPRQANSNTNWFSDPDRLREAEQRLQQASISPPVAPVAIPEPPPFSIARQESQDRANQNQELHDVVLRQKILGELRQEFKEREQIAEEKQVTLLRQTLATSMDRFLNS